MTASVPQSVQSQVTSSDPSRPTTSDITTSASISPDAHDASLGQSTAAAATTAELASAKVALYAALRRFADFPIEGIVFIDIMPIFQDPKTHAALLRALELQALLFAPAPVLAAAAAAAPIPWVDVVVGLDARGFLFGPGLALKLNAGFAPVRKQGKLPGPCITASYEKEYGADYFQIQEGAIKPGQKVLIVDDIIATGGSAAAAGELVKKLGGELVGYMFILEIQFLKGREKLGDAPVITLLEEAE